MADNITVTPGTGATVATDEVGGRHYQRVKLAHGVDGSAVDASGTDPLPVISVQTVATAVLTSVSASATTVTVLAANTARRGAYVFNDSTAVLYLKLGATASTTSHTVQVPAYGLYELPLPVYTGVIDGLWATATGSARVTEVS